METEWKYLTNETKSLVINQHLPHWNLELSSLGISQFQTHLSSIMWYIDIYIYIYIYIYILYIYILYRVVIYCNDVFNIG